MRFLGRLSFAASYCLFSLTALSCHMASGLAVTETVSDRDFARAAKEAAPRAAAKVGVAVDADGSLLVRLPSNDEESHRGTIDDDGVRKHVVVRADGSIDGHTVDDITGADSAETSEPMRLVSRNSLYTEEFTDGALVDEGSAGVREHSKSHSVVAAMQTMTGKQTMLFIIILLLIIVFAVVCFFRVVGFKEMAPPPKAPPVGGVLVMLPTPPQDTEVKSSGSRQSPQSLEPEPQDNDEKAENRARLAGRRHASGQRQDSKPTADAEPAAEAVGMTDSLNTVATAVGPSDSLNSSRDEREPAAEAVGPTDSRNTKRSSRGSKNANAMKEPGPLPKGEGEGPAPAPPAPKEGEIGAEGCTTSDDINTHLAEGESMGFSTKGKGKGWQGGGRSSAAAPKARE